MFRKLLQRENRQLTAQLKEAHQRYEDCLASSRGSITHHDKEIMKELQNTRAQLNTVLSVVKGLAKDNDNGSEEVTSLPTNTETSITSSQKSDENQPRRHEWPMRTSARDLLHAAASESSRRSPTLARLVEQDDAMSSTEDLVEIVEELPHQEGHESQQPPSTHSAAPTTIQVTEFMWTITDDGKMVREEKQWPMKPGAR